MKPNDPAVIEDLLTGTSTWAVVGLSRNVDRTAHHIAGWLKRNAKMRVIPVHPKAETVFGEQGYASLAEIPEGPIRVVDLFVNSAAVGEVVDEAIAEKDRLGIEAVWFQLDVVDEVAAERAEQAGLKVVRNTCPKIEWPKIFGA